MSSKSRGAQSKSSKKRRCSVSHATHGAWEMADALEVTLDELGGREWPPGGERPLSGEERELVDDYRRMDEDDRPGFIQTARTYAYAGEAKKEGLLPIPPLAEKQVREEATR